MFEHLLLDEALEIPFFSVMKKNEESIEKGAFLFYRIGKFALCGANAKEKTYNPFIFSILQHFRYVNRIIYR